MIFLLVLSRKMIFLFPENMTLFFRRKMKDVLSQKNGWKYIFCKFSEEMVFLKKNCTGIWSFLYCQERSYFFFPKIWSYSWDHLFRKKKKKKKQGNIFFVYSVKMYFFSLQIWYYPSTKKQRRSSPEKYILRRHFWYYEKDDIHPRKYGTAKPPDSGHLGSAQNCPLFRGVRCWQDLTKYSNIKHCWLNQAM